MSAETWKTLVFISGLLVLRGMIKYAYILYQNCEEGADVPIVTSLFDLILDILTMIGVLCVLIAVAYAMADATTAGYIIKFLYPDS